MAPAFRTLLAPAQPTMYHFKLVGRRSSTISSVQPLQVPKGTRIFRASSGVIRAQISSTVMPSYSFCSAGSPAFSASSPVFVAAVAGSGAGAGFCRTSSAASWEALTVSS